MKRSNGPLIRRAATSALAGRLGGCNYLIRSCSVGTLWGKGLTTDLVAWVSTWHHQCHCSSNRDLVVLVEHMHGRAVGDVLLIKSSANHASSSTDRSKEIALMEWECTPYFIEIEATSVGMTSKRVVRTFMHYVG